MSPDDAVRVRDYLVHSLAEEHQTFLNVIGAIPDDKLAFKPEERLMDCGRLSFHVATSAPFFVQVIQDGKTPEMEGPPPEPELPPTTRELVGACKSILDEALAAFRSFDGETLQREVSFFGMPAQPAVVFIHWHLVHLIHHRGQLTTYLRIAGARVPSVYGPTADVSFEDMMSG
jgi:uncharacterized damage-inducible protein DinB